MAADEHNAKYFRSTQIFAGFNKVFSSSNSALGYGDLPGCVLRHWPRTKRFVRAAHRAAGGEAVLDSEILTSVIKDVDRRFRPHRFRRAEIFLTVGFSNLKEAISAASAASLPATQLPRFSIANGFRRAISEASLARLARVRIGQSRWIFAAFAASHFSSDVFAGAALGLQHRHFVVLRPDPTLVSKMP